MSTITKLWQPTPNQTINLLTANHNVPVSFIYQSNYTAPLLQSQVSSHKNVGFSQRKDEPVRYTLTQLRQHLFTILKANAVQIWAATEVSL